MQCWRTPRQIAQTPAEMLFVCRQLTGTLGLEQDGREIVLSAGDVTLIDPQLAYGAKFSAGSSLLLSKIPPGVLEARLGSTRQMVLRSIAPSDAAGGLTSSFLAMLPRTSAGCRDPLRPHRQGSGFSICLRCRLATAVGAERAEDFIRRTPLALTSVRAAIEARLTDPALNPAGIAARCCPASACRYANAVLARGGTSIARLIPRQSGCVALPQSVGRSVAGASHIERNCDWLGVFRHDPLRPEIQGGLWRATERVSRPHKESAANDKFTAAVYQFMNAHPTDGPAAHFTLKTVRNQP